MKGSLIEEYVLENETFTLHIIYDYEPYHPADMNGPAEGGGCDEITFKVIAYRNKSVDWPVLTPVQEKELTDNFYKILEDKHVYDHFQEICDAEAEAALQVEEFNDD